MVGALLLIFSLSKLKLNSISRKDPQSHLHRKFSSGYVAPHFLHISRFIRLGVIDYCGNDAIASISI